MLPQKRFKPKRRSLSYQSLSITASCFLFALNIIYKYSWFLLSAVVMFWKSLHWISEYWTPRGNIWLGSCEPLVKNFSPTEHHMILFYLCFCLNDTYSIHVQYWFMNTEFMANSAITHAWTKLLLLFTLSRVQLFVTPWIQHARLPCPSLSPSVCSNSCPLSWWCHPIISSSVVPFSSYLQSFPASGSFPVSQFFPSGGQSIRASASAAVLPMNIQGWFPLGLTGLISLLSKGLSRVFSNTTVQKHQSSVFSIL